MVTYILKTVIIILSFSKSLSSYEADMQLGYKDPLFHPPPPMTVTWFGSCFWMAGGLAVPPSPLKTVTGAWLLLLIGRRACCLPSPSPEDHHRAWLLLLIGWRACCLPSPHGDCHRGLALAPDWPAGLLSPLPRWRPSQSLALAPDWPAGLLSPLPPWRPSQGLALAPDWPAGWEVKFLLCSCLL
jgi:hypothetical protein